MKNIVFYCFFLSILSFFPNFGEYSVSNNKFLSVLNIFRTNQIITGVLLLPYIVLLYASVFILDSTPPTIESSGILSDWVYGLLGGNILLSNIIAIVLIWLQSFLINAIALKHRLQNEFTLFPGLFYILLCCLLPDFLYLSPVLMGNTFFIIALGQILDCYQKNSVADKIYIVGFWLGIAGLFYFSFNLLIFWAIMGLSTLRVFRIKEVLQVLFGLFSVFILAGTYYFWFGEFDIFWKKQFVDSLTFWGFESTNNYFVWIKGSVIALLVIASTLASGSFMSKKVMQVQRKITVLVRSLVVIALTILFQAGMSMEHLLIFMVPLCFFASFYFSNMKRNFAESLHLVILFGVLLFQYRTLFLGV